LYDCHCKAAALPLPFNVYKRTRQAWEKAMFADPTDVVAKRKQAELEAVLGL
jgi:hypothetical protein